MKGNSGGLKLEKRRLEKLDISTSLLGFGCMRFPVLENGDIDETEAEKMLDKAIAAGVNYIDTAYPYHSGKSEPFVGKALKKYDRDSFYLATKLPVWLVEKEEDVDRLFEEQLERLQTDYIDFYLMHALNKERWDAMNKLHVVERLEELKKEGKIRYLGFSFHDDYEVFEEILTAREWDFCQIQLNYMDANEQAGMKGYKLTEERKVPLVIMEPIKGGSLAGFSEDINERFHKLDADASVASFALRWVGTLPNVKVILSGMSTMEQVDDNLKTFKEFKVLNEDEKAAIDEIVTVLNNRVQNGCTGCRYCMPCPSGVNIPAVFRMWNLYHIYQNFNTIKFDWNNMPAEEKPDNCVQCGQCEDACPQKIRIREDLLRVTKDLGKYE